MFCGRRRWAALGLAVVAPALAMDLSPAVILQWFETTYRTMEARAPELFLAGYGTVWTPPPFRADTGDQSVGYDVYDRFDLGRPERPTAYGTEEELRGLAGTLHRAGMNLHVDFVMNHNGYSNLATPGFVAAGGYPGLAITLPNDIDGDFHSAYAGGVEYERLAGLLDIAHEKERYFIRTPVTPGDPRNLRAGTTAAFGRLANVPDPKNRRFYPQPGYNTMKLFDPMRNERDIPVHSFNPANPMGGEPTMETATGYLMRNAQWLIQVIGVDGLRIDAAKHVPGFVLDMIDRGVYRMNPRRLLDGTQNDVFTYSEVFDANPRVLLPHVKKTINHGDPGRIGGNRDTLDFKLYFALKENLEQTAVPGAWQRIKDAALDVADDGLHNGSAGVTFVQSHDVTKPYALENVAQAYTLLMPGNTVVYFNGKELGENRPFPLPGRWDALSEGFLARLLAARNTHGRGNYAERWDGTEGLFAFERSGSMLVLLSNRGDAGFDSRTLTNVGFRPGTLLTELSGNAKDAAVNPRKDIPEVVRVFGEGGVSKVNVRFQRPSTISTAGRFDFHGKGVLVYGLATPAADLGIELSPAAEQGKISVVRADSLTVRVRTKPVRLLGADSLRDEDADGDEALLRLDGGVDVNGNGQVDFRTAGSGEYGFERFVTKRSPLLGATRGDGEFRQDIDMRGLAEGLHFLTVRVYRRQPAGSPAVFSEYRKVIYLDRAAPAAELDSVRFGELWIRSKDATATQMRVVVNAPETMTDAAILAAGGTPLARVDRAVFKGGAAGLRQGTNRVAVMVTERNGTSGVTRLTAVVP
ncbi:MAG: hypothetical protein JNM66_24915 [Bryobacterales bacterium]|nr:hypothetical protein [Bryobacterales bacterium]